MSVLSIVVPIYRVEAYIEQCIDSVLNQSFKDLELILVDDGSDDQCPEICDQYAEKDTRVTVIHQKNGGVSKARNSGLELATGDYVLFVDGDDFLECDILEDLNDHLQKNRSADMFLGRIAFYYNENRIERDTKKYSISGMEKANGIDYFARFIEEGVVTWNSATMVLKRSFLINNKIRFEKGRVGAEDFDFYIKSLVKAEEIQVFNRALICYRRDREGSLTTNPSGKVIFGQLHVYRRWYERIQRLPASPKSREICRRFLGTEFMKTVIKIDLLEEREVKRCIRYVKKNKYIIKELQTNVRKYRYMQMVYRLFGIRCGIWILKQYHWIREKMEGNIHE